MCHSCANLSSKIAGCLDVAIMIGHENEYQEMAESERVQKNDTGHTHQAGRVSEQPSLRVASNSSLDDLFEHANVQM